MQVGAEWLVSFENDKCLVGKCVLDEEECAVLEMVSEKCGKPCPDVN